MASKMALASTIALLSLFGGLVAALPTTTTTSSKSAHDRACIEAPNCEIVDNGKGGTTWNVTHYDSPLPENQLDRRSSGALLVFVDSTQTNFGSVNPTTMYSNMYWECTNPPSCSNSPWWTYTMRPYGQKAQSKDVITVTAEYSDFSTAYQVQMLTEAAWKASEAGQKWTSYPVWVPTGCGVAQGHSGVLECTSKTTAWQGTGASHIHTTLFSHVGGPILATLDMQVTVFDDSSFNCGGLVSTILGDIAGLTGTYGSIVQDILGIECG